RGSSRTHCTPSLWTCHAATGSSSADGPRGRSMPAPADRKAGNHSVRWRTTSRAVHPGTGDGAFQDRAPRTRSVNTPAIRRCRSAGGSDGAIGDQPLQLGVALVDAGLHAAAQPRVAALEAVDQRLGAQPGAAAAEVLEPERLQRDAVRLALEREGLDDAVRAHLVEAAVEPVLRAVAHRDVPPAAAGARVPLLDPGLQALRAHPPGVELGIGVGAEQAVG